MSTIARQVNVLKSIFAVSVMITTRYFDIKGVKMKWNKKQLQDHIRDNIWSEDEDSGTTHGYGAAVVVAALYKKLYGELPKIGLSGFQAEAVKSVIEAMPSAES